MKWFEKHTRDRNSRDARQIKQKFGLAGYGIYESLQQIVAENMEGNDFSEWGFVAKSWSMKTLAEEIGCSEAEFRLFVEFCDQQLILERKNNRLFMPILLERMNEYAKRAFKGNKEKQENTESTDNPDTTDTPNNRDISASQHNTITTQPQTQKQVYIAAPKVAEPKKHSEFMRFESLSEDVLAELAQEYSISVDDVRKTKQRMKDWLDSKGKTYKNYKAGLRTFITGNIEKGTIQPKVKPKSRLADLIPDQEGPYAPSFRPSG